MSRTPLIISVTGPSGTGKTAVVNNLCKMDSTITRCITATTRTPRPGEVDGKDYHFLSREDFTARLAKGDFLEHNPNYHNNMYGTLRAVVEAIWNQGSDAISDANIHGVRVFREKIPKNHFAILLLPPSRERLAMRLTQRDPNLAEQGAARLAAMEADFPHMHDPHYVFTNPDMIGSTLMDYDAVFTNDDLEVTTYALHARILKEREKRA